MIRLDKMTVKHMIGNHVATVAEAVLPPASGAAPARARDPLPPLVAARLPARPRPWKSARDLPPRGVPSHTHGPSGASRKKTADFGRLPGRGAGRSFGAAKAGLGLGVGGGMR